MTFTQETTDGFTDHQLAALNDLWGEVVEHEELDAEGEPDRYKGIGDQFWNHLVSNTDFDASEEGEIDWEGLRAALSLPAPT